MKFQLDTGAGTYAIRGYRPGAILVNDEELTRSFLITPDRLLKDWEPQGIDELQAAHLLILLELEPEIVLLGTGTVLHFPDPALTAVLTDRRIGVEVMDTAAACRSYMVLMSEGRRVAAAMLLGKN
jgi:uncharacterized protein